MGSQKIVCRIVALVAAAIVSAAFSVAAPLVVTSSTDATAMVNALLAGAPGLTIVPGSATYTGAATASGTFSGGTGIIPFDSGVVLTTGLANFVVGPNDSGAESDDNGAAGDAALTTIAGVLTFNASILQFQFIPTGNVVSFQFVFGSEEYNEFVGSPFNDVFAFFLNGTNIALVPGTSTPITINNVNNGSNASIFFDNTSGARNTQLDGLVGASVSVFATGPVNPGVVNTIRLAIADSSDEILDSAVFLAGGSFTAQLPSPVIPEPGSFTLLGSGLLAVLAAVRNRR